MNIQKQQFNSLINIQHSLNLIINACLQIQNQFEGNREKSLNFYQTSLLPQMDNETVDTLWEKYKCIDLKRFIHTNFHIDLNWDFTVVLSEENDTRQKLLSSLIPVRACYEKIVELMEQRNELFNKLDNKLSLYKKLNKISDNFFEYKNKNLINTVGVKIYIELKSCTNELYKSVKDAIIFAKDSFKKIELYAQNKFPNKNTLPLSIPDELKTIYSAVD
jgi:hypothetical protein